jgi:hypothetical protein
VRSNRNFGGVAGLESATGRYERLERLGGQGVSCMGRKC